MIKTIYLLLVFIFTSLHGFSQRIDVVWPIGYSCCGHPNFGAMNLDFRSSPMIVNMVVRHQSFDETCGSVCDVSGNLLFTSNGAYIANALDDTMQNGSGLNPSYFTSQHQDGLTIPQGNLVLPSLTDSNQYILFHNTIDDYFNTGASLNLYTTTIDMSLNGGLGAVLNKNSVLYNDSMAPGRIVACRHANGRDWWITVRKLHSLQLVEFLYAPNGISGPYYQNLSVPRDFNGGQSAFNPKGTKYAYFELTNGLEIADFDRCTGQLSNQLHFPILDSSSIQAGICFSPNGRFLYVATESRVYQFDCWATNVNASRITVGVLDGFLDPITFNITAFWIMALGPDGKIYMSTGNSTPYLHVINHPDSLGIACDLCQHCIQLPALNAFTMPNFPNYALGAEAGSVCDSLGVGVTELADGKNAITIFPNPASNNATIKYLISKNALLIIVNSLGEVVQQISLSAENQSATIDLSKFKSGAYTCKMVKEGKVDVGRLIVMH